MKNEAAERREDNRPAYAARMPAILRAILEVTGGDFDDGFHLRVARGLAEALDCHTAFVGQLLDCGRDRRIRTLAVWSRGRARERVEYRLAGSPCAEVIRTGILQVERDVCGRFPADRLLDEVGAESYLGAVIRGAGGEPVGHLAALDDRPILDREESRTIIRIFAARAAVEIDRRTLRTDKRLLEEQLARGSRIIGDSAALGGVLEHAAKVAPTDATVLITGETGTGKELVARAVHAGSRRRERVMVTVNCAALPKDLLESELFGHEPGAFTGATRRKRGRFELASGGTLFLDEVGELSAAAQAKLLRVLQEGEIERLGGESTIRVDVRLIAATHRDLAAMVEAGTFRADLYYRLNVFPIPVPPLRERREDIPALVEHFVALQAARLGKPLAGFAETDVERLSRHSWPGNVRELQNVVERAAILSPGSRLSLAGVRLPAPSPEPAPGADDDALDTVIAGHVRRVLEECDGVIEGPWGAAQRLGIKPSTLRSRMKKLGLR